MALAILGLAGSLGASRAGAAVSLGGVTSENLEWIANVPVGGFTEGGRLFGPHLFVTDDVRGLVIFEVSDAETPAVVGEVNLPHALENEDIATNGRIALISQMWTAAAVSEGEPVSRLNVIDVSDAQHPKVVATLPGGGDHTYECIFDCRWAYGSTAADIIDLADPGNPRIAGNWKREIGLPVETLTHDTTEVAPGRVLVAGDGEVYYLDTTDALHPKLLAQSERVPNSYLHTVSWPNSGRHEFMFSSTESLGPSAHCTLNDAVQFAYFRTWNASDWKRTGTFEVVDEYRPSNGLLLDGDPPVSVHGTTLSNNGCSTHWFETHPNFKRNGLVALAAFSHGMKLLQVDNTGEITEKGYFLPHTDDVGAAYWITDRILYSVSFERGIDILRYTGPTGPAGL